MPGEYKVGINQSISDPVNVDAGAVSEFLLGGLNVNESFTIYGATGRRLGYYSDKILLVPGIYRVVMSNGPTHGNIVVKAGKVTIIE